MVMVSEKLIGRHSPARLSFLRGQAAHALPADPKDDSNEAWLENEGEDGVWHEEERLPSWKWAKDKVSQYQRRAAAS